MYDIYKNLLKEYVSFKSISTDEIYKEEMNKTVSWLSQTLKKYKFEVKVWEGKISNPVVFAEYTISKDAETILIYGHYDVQPAEKEDGWKSDPFTLAESKGKLLARGVVDNKGQNLVHIVAIGELIKNNELKYNIKFMLEGNEETANPEIAEMTKTHKKELEADYIIISDGEIVGSTPTIEASLRGGFSMKVIYTTGKNNLHSGLYGGAVPNAGYELSKFIGTLYDKNNKVAIKDFYKGVIPIPKDVVKAHNTLIKSEAAMAKSAGVKNLKTEKGIDFFSQIGLRPTIQVTGFKTGYIGNGYSNIVPAQAEVRLNIRVVSPQKPKDVYNAVLKHLKDLTPSYVDIKIEHTEFNDAVLVDTEQEKVKEITSYLKKSFKKEPIIKYVGGSIPIVSDFKKILGVDTILVSLGNDDCNMHGVDENYTIDLVKKGLEFSTKFFSKK